MTCWGFPGGAVVKNRPAGARDTGGIPGLGRSHTPRSSQAHTPQPLSLCWGARRPNPASPGAAAHRAREPWSPSSAAGEAVAVRAGKLQREQACPPQPEGPVRQWRPGRARGSTPKYGYTHDLLLG